MSEGCEIGYNQNRQVFGEQQMEHVGFGEGFYIRWERLEYVWKSTVKI